MHLRLHDSDIAPNKRHRSHEHHDPMSRSRARVHARAHGASLHPRQDHDGGVVDAPPPIATASSTTEPNTNTPNADDSVASASPTPTLEVSNLSAKAKHSEEPEPESSSSHSEPAPTSDSAWTPQPTTSSTQTSDWSPTSSPLAETETPQSTYSPEPSTTAWTQEATSSSTWTQEWHETSTWHEQLRSSTEAYTAAPAVETSSYAVSSAAPTSAAAASSSATVVVPIVAAALTSSAASSRSVAGTTASRTVNTVFQIVSAATNKASPSAATPSTEASKSNSSSTSVSSGAIAGIVVGCVAAIVLLFALLALCRRRRNNPVAHDEDKVFGNPKGSNLKRNGTAHSAMDFSDDPVSPGPRWRHLSHLPLPTRHRDRGSLASNAGVAGVGSRNARGLGANGSAAASGTPPGHKKSLSTNNEKWDTMSDDDAHEPAVQVRNNEDFRLTHYDDWLNYNQLDSTPPPTAGLNGPSQSSLVPPVKITPLETPERKASYELYNAYGTERQPVLQRLPWLRVTPPVSPGTSLVEPSHAEFGIAR